MNNQRKLFPDPLEISSHKEIIFISITCEFIHVVDVYVFVLSVYFAICISSQSGNLLKIPLTVIITLQELFSFSFQHKTLSY